MDMKDIHQFVTEGNERADSVSVSQYQCQQRLVRLLLCISLSMKTNLGKHLLVVRYGGYSHVWVGLHVTISQEWWEVALCITVRAVNINRNDRVSCNSILEFGLITILGNICGRKFTGNLRGKKGLESSDPCRGERGIFVD